MADHTKPTGSGPTPTMTVAACIAWLTDEIEALKDKEQAETDIMNKLMLTHTYLHLNVMKEQLVDHTMAMLDDYYGADSQ